MDTPNQTFPTSTNSLLLNSPAHDRINANNRWLMCPACGRGKILKLQPTTIAENLIVYCKVCKRETIVNISQVLEP